MDSSPVSGLVDGHPEVRPYEDFDESEVLALLASCLPGWQLPLARERFRWKHERNPFGVSQRDVVVLENRIVGFSAGMRWRVELDGRVYSARRGTDLAVALDLQRRGIYQEMRRHRRQMPDEEDVSYRHRNDLSEGAARKAGGVVGRHLSSDLAPRSPVRLVAWRLWGRETPVSCRGFSSVGELLEDEAKVEDLLARCVPAGRLVTHRSVDYLRWRYAQYPGRDYVTLPLHESDGRLRGLLIGRAAAAIPDRSPPYFEVSELIVPEGDRAAMRRLLRGVWRARAAYAAVVTPYPFRSRWEAAVAGFPVARRRGWWFAARAKRPDVGLPEDIADPRRWQLPLGDLEAI